jgi:NDP-sugar pyrophosphorylase family protein
MKSAVKTNQIDVVILCGGKGSRLRPAVSDRPKAMARIGQRPFLDILIDYIAGFGFSRFILCSGHLGGMIQEYYRKRKKNLKILFSQENSVLGTAGAVKNAEAIIKSSSFLVVNGDSFCRMDLKKFISFHLNKKAPISMALARNPGMLDAGNVGLGRSGRVNSFSEKKKNRRAAFINTGVYCFTKQALPSIPKSKNVSLEKDIFPQAAKTRRIFGYLTEGLFIDIGTPARYARAKKLL